MLNINEFHVEYIIYNLFYLSFSPLNVVDTRKNAVVECTNLCIKNVLNSSNLIFKLEQWRLEVESLERKVISLKLGDIFGIFRFRKHNDQ